MATANPLEVISLALDGTVSIRHTPETNLDIIAKALTALDLRGSAIDQLKNGTPLHTPDSTGSTQEGIAILPQLSDDGHLEAVIIFSTRNLTERLPDLITQLHNQLHNQLARTTLPTRPGTHKPSQEPDTLAPRQHAILQHMAQGLTNRQIAQRISYSESTVRSETMNIYRKLTATGRRQAVAKARHLGLILTAPEAVHTTAENTQTLAKPAT